jgi:exonuclease III
MNRQDADVVCLQEIKVQEDQLDERFYPKEYHCYYQSAEKKGYSGTAIFSNISRYNSFHWNNFIGITNATVPKRLWLLTKRRKKRLFWHSNF